MDEKLAIFGGKFKWKIYLIEGFGFGDDNDDDITKGHCEQIDSLQH